MQSLKVLMKKSWWNIFIYMCCLVGQIEDASLCRWCLHLNIIKVKKTEALEDKLGSKTFYRIHYTVSCSIFRATPSVFLPFTIRVLDIGYTLRYTSKIFHNSGLTERTLFLSAPVIKTHHCKPTWDKRALKFDGKKENWTSTFPWQLGNSMCWRGLCHTIESSRTATLWTTVSEIKHKLSISNTWMMVLFVSVNVSN